MVKIETSPPGPLRAVTLTGERVVLEPLSTAHSPELWRAADEPGLFDYLLHEMRTSDDMDEWIQKRLAACENAKALVFALRDAKTGVAFGSTSLYDYNAQHRKMEIGHTWLGRSHRRTGANTETKLLLLTYAFETLKAARVQLKCDARNQRSETAILRLGAKKEGVMRSFMILPDGHHRDTALFSILETEWPEIKARLQGLLIQPRKPG